MKKLILIALISLFLLSLFLNTQATPTTFAQTTPLGWRETGLNFSPDKYPYLCFDGLQANTIYFSESDGTGKPFGTYDYNWVTNQKTTVSQYSSEGCNELGIFPYNYDRNFFLYSRNYPDGLPLPLYPATSSYTNFVDGEPFIFAGQYGSSYISRDLGKTWVKQVLPFYEGSYPRISINPTDSKIFYATLANKPKGSSKTFYTFYHSSDMGVTWEERVSLQADPYDAIRVETFFSKTAPINTILFSAGTNYTGGSLVNLFISTDGAKSFRLLANYRVTDFPVKYFFTNQGLLRYDFSNETRQYTLELSKDFGNNWETLDLPPPVAAPVGKSDSGYALRQVDFAPDNLFLSPPYGGGDLWHSADSGKSWHKLGDNLYNLSINFHAPLTLADTKNNKLYIMPVPDADKTLTNKALPNGVTNSLYFPETAHNLSPLFHQYWEQNGGLAQFGYPKTEAFREVNPSDGKVYTVQYFERNRFEYHPENKGTPYEVLLGLLGNQLTQTRRDKAEAPFKAIADPKLANVTYFVDTGHTLRSNFKQYWEQHGGLAIYGYPISEMFEETNPDDGKTYVVQYFERNRFEYHPENNGSPYEVLLGLLGNTLLKQKGWL